VAGQYSPRRDGACIIASRFLACEGRAVRPRILQHTHRTPHPRVSDMQRMVLDAVLEIFVGNILDARSIAI